MRNNPKADDNVGQLEPVDLSLKSRGPLRISLSNYAVNENNNEDSEVVDLSLKRSNSTSPGINSYHSHQFILKF